MKILTICTAAYNAELYIRKMLDSILACRNKDLLEVIVVNDGSIDNTCHIIEEYVVKYPTIVFLINKENGGSGSARNIAFKKATGKYLKLIDADDWVETGNLDLFIEDILHINSDAIWNDYCEAFCGSENKVLRSFVGDMIPLKEYNLLEEKFPLPKRCLAMHGVTFRTSILQKNNIRLSEGMSYVDLEYLALPLPYIKTITYVNKNFYIYQLGLANQSVSPKIELKNQEKKKIIIDRLNNYYKQNMLNMSENAKNLMKNILGMAYISYIKTLIIQKEFNLYNQVKSRDLEIKKENFEIWQLISQLSGSIRLMRKFNYLGYYPMIIYLKLKDLRKN